MKHHRFPAFAESRQNLRRSHIFLCYEQRDVETVAMPPPPQTPLEKVDSPVDKAKGFYDNQKAYTFYKELWYVCVQGAM